MSKEFQRIEGVVNIVVSKPVSFLVYGLMVAGRWAIKKVCSLVARFRSSPRTKKPAPSMP